MPANPGTFEILARELGRALEPLKDLLGPQMPARLGIQLPDAILNQSQVVSAFTQAAGVAGDLTQLIQDLNTAIQGGDEGQMISKGAQLLQKVIAMIQACKQLGDTISNNAGSLSGNELSQVNAFTQELAIRTLSFVLIEYMYKRARILTDTLAVIGLIDNEEVEPGGSEPLGVPYVKKQIHFDRITELFEDPESHLQNIYGWGSNSLDADLLFSRLKSMLEGLNIPADVYGSPPTLEAYLFTLQPNNSNPKGLDLELRVPGNFEFDQEIDLISPWKATIEITGTFAAGVTGTLKPPADIELQPPSGQLNVAVLMGLKAQKDDGPMIFIGKPNGSRLEALSVGGALGIDASWDSGSGKAKAEPAVEVAIEKGKLVIDLSEGDGFLQQILSGLNVEAEFDIKGIWTQSKGLQLVGSATIEVLIPVHVNLGIAEIKGIYVIGVIGGDTPFALELATELKANLGPLKGVVEKMGIKMPMKFPENGDGNLGPLDLGIGFRPPNGIGLSLDVGVVKGGGYLYLDFEKEEYAGALELAFAGIVTLKAIGLITTRMPDGSKGFSLLVIITAEFGTGIQLGFGFTLLGVGGLVGLNRTMKLEPLMEGVRTGAIESVMFPQNVIENAPKIISDLRKFFPAAQDIFLIGPMAKIGWGTPTLISLSLGIIIEIPGNIAILGVLKIALPTEEAALIKLQVNFFGAIEFDKKRAYFFASLFDSRVLFITLEGEMGLLIGWGSDSNFVVSVGGFHPQYTPPPLPFPNPKRISLNILNESWGRIRVMGYFAVTSNSVQFGVRAELFFGFSEFKLEGHLAFDALFQFNPFFFIIEISCGVSLKVFGIGLFSISLKFSLEGPSPWRAKGYGKLKLLFFTIKAKFDFTWGEKKDTKVDPVEVMPLLLAEYNKLENWTASVPSSNSLSVSLRALPEGGEELVLHPLGTINITQRAVPLEITIDKVGSKKASDGKKFYLDTEGGFSKSGDLEEDFAIAQYQELKESEKLSKPAFQNETSGLNLSASDDAFATGKAVKRNVRYEEVIIDSGHRLLFHLVGILGRLFNHFLGGSAVTKSVASQAMKKKFQPFEEKIAVGPDQYAVAFNSDNKAYNGTAVFSSEAKAREYLNTQTAQDPELATNLHVIPAFELNSAA